MQQYMSWVKLKSLCLMRKVLLSEHQTQVISAETIESIQPLQPWFEKNCSMCHQIQGTIIRGISQKFTSKHDRSRSTDQE